MAVIQPLQISFSGGELSPLMEMRHDLAIRETGVASLYNMFAHLQGPAETRYGTRRDTDVTGEYGKLFTFYVDKDTSFEITVTLTELKIHTPGDPGSVQTFVSPWTTLSRLEPLRAFLSPVELKMFLLSPFRPPYWLVYDPSGPSWTFELIPFTAKPAEWLNSSSPSTMTFFQGRAWYAGVPGYPEDFWGSRPGSDTVSYFIDMTLGANPDDAIQYSMEKKGLIEWLESADTLLIGTESGEYVGTSDGGIIVPGDIQVKQQSSNGSASIQARRVGNNVLYASPDKRKIRTMSFEWTKDAWLSLEMTFAAEHITETRPLQKIVFAQSPHNLMWAVTETGGLLGATYDPVSQAAGFHFHESADPIIDVSIRRYQGTDELWMLVLRSGLLSLEKYDPAAKMDSFVEFVFDPPESLLTGLTHLAGRTCQVIADGAVHPDVVVTGGGEAQLEKEVSSAFIGLGYSSIMIPLSRDDGMSLEGFSRGSARPAKKRWVKIWARIINSWKPKIDGVRPPERGATSVMGLIEPPATEDVQITQRGWDKEGVVTIEQDLPLRTVIAGFFGELDQELA